MREAWTYTCPAFKTNRFMLCKHSVHGLCVPEYRIVQRSRHIPFISLCLEDSKRRARMSTELQENDEINNMLRQEKDLSLLENYSTSNVEEEIPSAEGGEASIAPEKNTEVNEIYTYAKN